jgi:RNA polymerase sigma-70 factor, ECF subfamily
MSEFATLASPYSMPVALHGDLDLTVPEAQTRSRALNQFLAGVELKAFKIAQASLRHEDDALDAVQDAMLQLARAYANRPQEEWKPLFYRILENRIRDMQRRRTVRGRVMAWLPLRGEDEGEEPDPIARHRARTPSLPGASSWTRR